MPLFAYSVVELTVDADNGIAPARSFPVPNARAENS